MTTNLISKIYEPFSRIFAVGLAVLIPLSSVTADPERKAHSVQQIAANEVLRRRHIVAEAQKLINAGSLAQDDNAFGEAMKHFKGAFEILPDSPAVESTRKSSFRRFQAATSQHAQSMIDQGRWEEARQALEEALILGGQTGYHSTLDAGITRMLQNLNDPEYYPTGLSPKHFKNVDTVKRLLILAKGYSDYGDYDRAIRSYQQILSVDKYNSAARRGMAYVERQIIAYSDVARDQARASNLRQVSEGWALPIPLIQSVVAPPLTTSDLPTSRRTAIEDKLKSIRLPSINFENAPLSSVLDFIRQKSIELDFAEQDINLKGFNIVLDQSTFDSTTNPGDRPISIQTGNVPLGVALGFVTRLSNTSFRIDDFAVSIISATAGSQKVLVNRSWVVPPGFLSSDTGQNTQAGLDPFAEPDPNTASNVLVKRRSAQEFLEEQGVSFSQGAFARYNAAANGLLVRNTQDQITLIDSLVQSAREGVNKMVEVSVKLISITQSEMVEKGFDWLLGQSNLGDSQRIFTSGGTTGNALTADGGNSDFPFVNPDLGAVGTFPVTAGLRTGDQGTFSGIEQFLDGTTVGSDLLESPATFAIAGVFTDPQFQVVTRLLNQSTTQDTVINTKVLTKPGQRALIEVTREFIYPTEYDPPELSNGGTGGNGGNGGLLQSGFAVTPATPTAFELRKLGQLIEVEPTLAGDNKRVSLTVSLDFSDFVGFVDYGSPISNNGAVITDNQILLPIFDAVKETTSITVWDGQTIAIGGLVGQQIIDTEDKIPFLGDLPVIGASFRSNSEVHEKTAIMLFVTVKLVDPGGQLINSPINDSEQPNDFPPRSSRPPSPAISPPLPSSPLPLTHSPGFDK